MDSGCKYVVVSLEIPSRRYSRTFVRRSGPGLLKFYRSIQLKKSGFPDRKKRSRKICQFVCVLACPLPIQSIRGMHSFIVRIIKSLHRKTHELIKESNKYWKRRTVRHILMKLCGRSYYIRSWSTFFVVSINQTIMKWTK